MILFKCDQKYIYERLFLYLNDEKEEEKRELERRRKANPARTEFLDIMQADDMPVFSKDFKKIEDAENAKLELERKSNSRDIVEYTDTLTTWLCDLVNSLHRSMDFELVEIKNEGVCVRYCPLDHANILGTQSSDLAYLDKSLADIVSVLDASIRCKAKFEVDIRALANLRAVHVPKWAGIGAVRYVPDHWLHKMDQLRGYQLEKVKYVKRKKEIDEKKEADEKERAVEADNK